MTTREWTVYLEAGNPDTGSGSLGVVNPRIADFADFFTRFRGSTSMDRHRWSVRFDLGAETALEAAQAAECTARLAADHCRMPNWPIDRLEVVDPEYRDVDPDVSNIPDLVSRAEAADLLGVSRHRIHELCEADGFPEPAIELTGGPVWMRPAIIAFGARLDGEPDPQSDTMWTTRMVDKYRSLGDRSQSEPQNRDHIVEQQDGVVRQLVSRHSRTIAATVVGIPVDEVNRSLARSSPDR